MPISEQPAIHDRFDLVISGGRILDRRSGSWRAADIGVSGGRVVAISDSLAGAQAARTIAAEGRPGEGAVFTLRLPERQAAGDDTLAVPLGNP